jgi:multicomponent Na+:H+ antiporter subunit E
VIGEGLSLKTAGQLGVRWAICCAVWWVISEGEFASLAVGVIAASVAAVLSYVLMPESLPRLSLAGVVRFVGFFLAQSALGGLDVSMRALKPSLPIDPGTLTYSMRLEPSALRVLFANTLSLLPGTLSARLVGDDLVVHALDRKSVGTEAIARVEERVADMFGIVLAEHQGVSG